ncbi:hypothetical protein [Micromonospora sp. WMMD1274]|uniref:hypothetical protein n=1 Tax=Micromonospora sp. WMMD1274 TaxID=3404116 RepID=UPI003B95E58C
MNRIAFARVATIAAGTTSAQPVAAAQNSGDADADSGNRTVYGVAGILLSVAGLAAGLLAYRRGNHAN